LIMTAIHSKNENDQEYLSKEGFERLKGELKHLKTVKRREIAASLEYARSLGDLSENSEYHEAKSTQESTEARVVELEAILSRAVLITHKVSPLVDLGSTIIVKNHESEQRFTIVGSEEANPMESKISNQSPLGQAFLGRKKGDKINVSTPKGHVEYSIIDIL